MTTVVIADDHTLVRQGIRALLEKDPQITIVGDVSDGQQAVEVCQQLRPDLLVIDIVMPRLNGIQAVERLKELKNPVRAIILSMYYDATLIHQALQKGASGYVLKQAVAEELQLALRAATRGETYLSPAVSTIMIKHSFQKRLAGESEDAYDNLSLREREVLKLLAEGNTNPEIARLLFISEKTVEKHRAAVMEKLDIHNLAGLVRMAIKKCLITINE
jgi:DNA-binding NarL/FixJ family response regulator